MIEIQQVTKRFQTVAALRRGQATVDAVRDVSLSVPAGSVRALVGPNGAGKSTLFGLILGFLHPTAGQVRIAGLEPRRYLRRHGATYLPERFRLPPEWTVRDTLTALARLESRDSNHGRVRTTHVLERFELGVYAERPLKTLSRGLLQRVGLAQALLADHDLVVFDEPTEGLDPLWRIRFRELVEQLDGEGRTVLLASHDLGEVERLAEQVILMEAGRVKEVFECRPSAEGPAVYEIELAAPSPALAEAFPGATTTSGRERPTYQVSVTDAEELSTRLAALIAGGGTVVSVRRTEAGLEERVQRALQAGESA